MKKNIVSLIDAKESADKEKYKKMVEMSGLEADSPKIAIETCKEIIKNISDVEPKNIKIKSTFKKKGKKFYICQIKLKSREETINILKNKRNVGNKNIFINEALTDHQKSIFLEVLKLKKDKKIQSCYTRGGLTYFKENGSEKAFLVRDFGNIPQY